MKLFILSLFMISVFSPNTSLAKKYYDDDIEELSDELGRLRKKVLTLEDRIATLEKGETKDKMTMQMCVVTSTGNGKKRYIGRSRTILEAQTQAREKCQKIEVADQCEVDPKCESYTE